MSPMSPHEIPGTKIISDLSSLSRPQQLQQQSLSHPNVPHKSIVVSITYILVHLRMCIQKAHK